MNSISKLPLSHNANLILYADDVLPFKPVDTAEDIDQLQQDVDSILKWITSQGLTANQSLKSYLTPAPEMPCPSVSRSVVIRSTQALLWST